ncbi:MAG: ubiquinone biosynthesis protein UbiH [Gallionellales bacterium GWA2_60_142]|nr:MAG: ubiquinone biosynthesis protein UbiH [Gallionellales bacterium GWA2_60_142]HCI13264.1 ubiquinone biosynthesis protein UbiH [Gallionellaceae bacterium]
MEFDIVIVGGGLVGASLAASLRHSGLSLALVESQCSPALPEDPELADWDSRIYAISPGSRRFLEEAGAWDHLATHRVAPVEEMRVFGDDGAKLEFSAYEMGVSELACILENRELQHALWQVLQQQDNLTLLHPARCASLSVGENFAELALQDGRSIRAKLIVGADGRDSWVRNQVGISAAPVNYRHHGVVANFTTERPHRGIAYQWFQPDGILALLPLPGNRVSMVWSVSPERSAELLTLTREELGDRVAAAARHTLGEMQVITPAAAFPLRLLVLPQIAAPRIALIGDAAHNMHPLAGQGVNTGFRDAQQLVKTLLDRGGCADCGDAQLLRRYDRKRKEDIYSMQATTYGLKHLFNNDDPILRKLRNLGMDATNRMTPLKKLLVQHALN